MSRAKKTCPCCGRNNVGPIKTWDRMTAYNDKAQNKLRSCIHCIREDDEYYAERWSEYYGEQGFPTRVQPVYRHGRRQRLALVGGVLIIRRRIYDREIEQLFADLCKPTPQRGATP